MQSGLPIDGEQVSKALCGSECAATTSKTDEELGGRSPCPSTAHMQTQDCAPHKHTHLNPVVSLIQIRYF